jgi:hypothetical protein
MMLSLCILSGISVLACAGPEHAATDDFASNQAAKGAAAAAEPAVGAVPKGGKPTAAPAAAGVAPKGGKPTAAPAAQPTTAAPGAQITLSNVIATVTAGQVLTHADQATIPADMTCTVDSVTATKVHGQSINDVVCTLAAIPPVAPPPAPVVVTLIDIALNGLAVGDPTSATELPEACPPGALGRIASIVNNPVNLTVGTVTVSCSMP